MARIRRKAQGWGVRIRFGEKLARDEWFPLAVSQEQEALAKDRHARLQGMAKLLDALGKHAEARVILEEAASTRNERGFRAIETMVSGLAPASPAAAKKPKTFRQVAELLSDGSLHELYPEEVLFKAEASREQSRARLAVFFPALGGKTFEEITADDLDEAKKLIPKCKQSTRAEYLRELRRVMRVAVKPLRLVEHTPEVTVPRRGKRDLFTFLYPAEDSQVCACVDIPFEYRFLYAFLCRNGTRISETLRITWDHIDLVQGTIHLAAAWTKTKRARYWDLDPDVLEALKLRRKQIPDAELVFVPPPGLQMTRHAVHRRFLADLELAGLERRALFNTSEGERRLRLHDTRASFVTLARAVGMPDRWIMDRSGHESAAVLEKYDRGVRHAQEKNLGWFAPMGSALGMEGAELGPKLGQSWAKAPKTPRNMSLRAVEHPRSQPPSQAINPANSGGDARSLAQEGGFGPSGFSISGQSSILSSDQLSELVELAQRAKRWHLVAALGKALDTLERAREQDRPKVASLESARRRKRDKGEP